MSSYVYFIKPRGMPGPIKIGCSQIPTKRLEALAVWSPYDLEIVATTPGDYKLEARLHDHFGASHSHREWFWPSDGLLSTIEKLKAGASIDEAIEFGPCRGFRTELRRKIARKGWSQDRRERASYSRRIDWAIRKLDEAKGGRFTYPNDIEGILRRWRGYGAYDGKEWTYHAPVTPVASEIDRLREFLSNVEAHAVPFPPLKLVKDAA
jgi:hypothetical protein